MFDADNPPETYKQFRREVVNSIENLEVDEDEVWPPALFVVGRKGDASVIFLGDIIERYEHLEAEDILEAVVPEIIRKHSGKFFAVVMPGSNIVLPEKEEQEILIIAMGGMENTIEGVHQTDVLVAEIDREDGEAILEIWDKPPIESFIDFLSPLRQAITPQG